jgi:hypothetical protein
VNKESQIDKFKKAASEAECDMGERAFDGVLVKVAQSKTHASDCALHNGPALKPGRCDCGATTQQ